MRALQALPPLPTISEIVKLYGLSAHQQLSQNFILDLNLCARIVRACGEVAGATVIEVGAGPGNLTRAALLAGARHVIAIEKDPRFLPALELLREAAGPERLTVVLADALEADEAALLAAAGAAGTPWEDTTPPRVRIVGNLPFSISTELLLKWLHQIPGRTGPFAFGRVPMTLLFQKEVALRLVAAVGSKEYGRLSVMSQHCTRVRRCFDISGAAFVPIPDVDSAVVNLTPLRRPHVSVKLPSLEYVLRQVFGQRRKVVRNAVSTLEHGAEVWKESGVEGFKRPEQLSVKEWAALANAFDEVSARMKQ